MVEKLEACPFCGGEAERFTIGPDEPNNAGGDVICCKRCQASSHVEFGRKENLVSRWNTRTRPTDEVEKLRETLGQPTIEMTHAALEESRRHDPPLLPMCNELWASEIIWRAMCAALESARK